MLGAAGAAAVLTFAPALGTAGATPFARALSGERAANARFEGLPDDLQFSDPARHEAEERRVTTAWKRMVNTPPADWREFVAKFSAIGEDGYVSLTDEQATVLLADAKRLLAVLA